MTETENSKNTASSSSSGLGASGPSGRVGARSDAHLAATMAFFDHVDELRMRLMRCMYVFMAGFAAFYWKAEWFLQVLRKPLFDALPPEGRKLYFTSLFENFMTHLKIAGYASLLFLSPYYFYQLWGFITPGLKERERKMVLPFVTATTFFFLGGASFAYFVLFPVGFKFFVTYGGPSDVPLLTIDSYYSTCLKLLLLFGVSFELPVLIVLLGALGLVDAATLRKHRRTAILVISVLAALFAPPDAMSMLILGCPLYIMFEGSIWVVQWMRAKRDAAMGSEPEPENPLVGRSKP
jgi:sec-independent protein translocase protein TatC